MRNRIRYGRWLIVLFLAVACLSPTAALASNKGIEVPCRVEPNAISLSIDDGTVLYGVVATGTSQDTTATGVNETQTVRNTSDGDETVDFDIKSSDAIGTTDWTLAETADANLFTHKASLDGGSTWPIAMIVADAYVPLATGIGPTGTVVFDLQIGMPTSISDYGVQHIITVTIRATESGG